MDRHSEAELELFTWRTRAGAEVDFVIYGPDGFWALEDLRPGGEFVPDR